MLAISSSFADYTVFILGLALLVLLALLIWPSDPKE